MFSNTSSFFRDMKLGRKLNIILLSIILLVILINSFILSTLLQKDIEKEITAKAVVLIETMRSVREYTLTQISPELTPLMEKSDRFFPQIIPEYSAREVFDNLRKQPQYSEFFYKEATLNPTNLRDKADLFETSVVEEFQKNTNLNQKTGFRKFPGGEIFYVARPLVVSEQSCLQCHSIPSAAPKSQIMVYGDTNGFNWKLNEIVGAHIISIPAKHVIMEAQQLKFKVIGLLSLGFLAAIVAINVFLRRSIVKPLISMAHWAKQVSTGNMGASFKHQSQDEIGILASSLQRLKVSVDMALNMLSQDQEKDLDQP